MNITKTNILIIVVLQIFFIINSILGTTILATLLLKIYLDPQKQSIKQKVIILICVYLMATISLFYFSQYSFLIKYIDIVNVIIAIGLVVTLNDLFIFNNIYTKKKLRQNIISAAIFTLTNLDNLLLKKIKLQPKP
jgi:hypothetical protein